MSTTANSEFVIRRLSNAFAIAKHGQKVGVTAGIQQRF
ncbi:porin [Burkholderia multivorans]|uniref:Porin n=1 Tax=Burkholderia multivorans TaxID=87883 RepID=A0A2S9MLH0_9BURK|nr:porin [Burkholderia multivorans]PRE98524.1 porin [Burkholderia multivorans]PRF59393.1 porin [Burkholderia multivorans]PRG24081.1 porin [Burkholderia multivorans]